MLLGLLMVWHSMDNLGTARKGTTSFLSQTEVVVKTYGLLICNQVIPLRSQEETKDRGYHPNGHLMVTISLHPKEELASEW